MVGEELNEENPAEKFLFPIFLLITNKYKLHIFYYQTSSIIIPRFYENQSYLNFMDFNKKLFYLCTIFSIECGKL